MPKVIMTCGKICSGKSTYSQKLRRELNAVRLISAYYVDDGLKTKFKRIFKPPDENEADVFIRA